MEKGADWIFVYRDTRLVQPGNYPAFLGEAERLVAKLERLAPRGRSTGRGPIATSTKECGVTCRHS